MKLPERRTRGLDDVCFEAANLRPGLKPCTVVWNARVPAAARACLTPPLVTPAGHSLPA